MLFKKSQSITRTKFTFRTDKSLVEEIPSHETRWKIKQREICEIQSIIAFTHSNSHHIAILVGEEEPLTPTRFIFLPSQFFPFRSIHPENRGELDRSSRSLKSITRSRIEKTPGNSLPC